MATQKQIEGAENAPNPFQVVLDNQVFIKT
jgi:hypothetical protein